MLFEKLYFLLDKRKEWVCCDKPEKVSDSLRIISSSQIARDLKRNSLGEFDKPVRIYLYKKLGQKISRKKLAKVILMDDFKRKVYLAAHGPKN